MEVRGRERRGLGKARANLMYCGWDRSWGVLEGRKGEGLVNFAFREISSMRSSRKKDFWQRFIYRIEMKIPGRTLLLVAACALLSDYRYCNGFFAPSPPRRRRHAQIERLGAKAERPTELTNQEKANLTSGKTPESIQRLLDELEGYLDIYICKVRCRRARCAECG